MCPSFPVFRLRRWSSGRVFASTAGDLSSIPAFPLGLFLGQVTPVHSFFYLSLSVLLSLSLPLSLSVFLSLSLCICLCLFLPLSLSVSLCLSLSLSLSKCKKQQTNNKRKRLTGPHHFVSHTSSLGIGLVWGPSFLIYIYI